VQHCERSCKSGPVVLEASVAVLVVQDALFYEVSVYVDTVTLSLSTL